MIKKHPLSSIATHLTAATLATLAALHVAWGRESAFPFSTRAALADAVVGTENVPSPLACFGVASALTVAAALLEGMPRLPIRMRRLGVIGVGAVLTVRGALGLAGATELVSPGSSSQQFRRLDRRIYSPLCLSLAVGTALSYR
jgi:hypothetical protein